MQQQIASYLFQHKTCPLPGLGTLTLTGSEAEADFTNKMIAAPKPVIGYSDAGTTDDGLLHYVVKKTGVQMQEASDALNQFCFDIKQKIEGGERFHLDHIGHFFTDASGKTGFIQQQLPAAFVQPVFAERVIHPDAEHQILVGDKETTNTVMTELLAPKATAKDRWWIWAIVLGCISLLAMLIYFTGLNGSYPFGNIIKI